MPSESRVGLRAELYTGYDGPTLRFTTRNPDDLVFLRNQFELLATGNSKDQRLDDCLGIYMVKCEAIQLIAADSKYKHLSITKTDDSTTVNWEQPPEEWLDACSLIDRLIGGGSGHQYLASCNSGSLAIVLSYRE